MLKSLRYLFVVLGLLATGAGCTTTGGPQGVIEFGGARYSGAFTHAPRLLELPAFTYPRAQFDAGIEGTAELAYAINDDGRTTDVLVRAASDPVFGELALKTARTLRYAPATDGFRRVACTVEVTFIFRLP